MDWFYYSADKKIFSNKVDALLHSHRTGAAIGFYFHDAFYSSLDWTYEPPMPLDFYYREQAQRIRDEYDYVVLFYSGGEDSTNILETFHYNNIRLDKIVCVGAFSQDTFTGSDENHNAEIYANCLPYIKELNLESITELHDYSKFFDSAKNFSIYNYDDQWYKGMGPSMSPHHWFWGDIENRVVPAQFKDKKVALVWGKDKTRLNNGKFAFNDMACSGYGFRSYNVLNNIHRVYFYWDYNNPNILLKQVAMLKKNPNFQIYNLKRRLAYISAKSPSHIISLRDKFLLKHTNSSIFDFYKAGLQQIDKDVLPKLVKSSAIMSRSYG